MDAQRLTIRHATLDDCRDIALLAQIAGDGVPDYIWSLSAEPGQPLLEIGMARAASESSNFSYRNSQLALLDDQVAGLLLGYRLPDQPESIDPADFPDLLRPLIELEQCVPGSYYINILACYPEFQNRGIGAVLIDRAAESARSLDCTVLSLEVFEENDGAVWFYKRQGFAVQDQRPVVPHPCYPYTGNVLLMTKPVT